MAKISNSFSPSPHVPPRRWKAPGKSVSRASSSPASAVYFILHPSSLILPGMATIISRSADETVALGRAQATLLRRGDVLALCGDLGAGKTHFVKGLAAALGTDAAVTSPTFTLIHEYPGGRLPLYHFDFYRLDDEDEALKIGLDEYLDG